MSLDRKLNEDSKNVFKTVIFSLQVGFTVDFVPDCLSGSTNVNTVFLPDSTKVCSVFSSYGIGNLISIRKMYLKL